MRRRMMTSRRRKRTFARRVRAVVNTQTETKRWSTPIDATTPLLNSPAILLPVISSGTTGFNRVGNRIKLVAIHIKIVTFNTDTNNFYRLRTTVYKRHGAYSSNNPVGTGIMEPIDREEIVVKKDKFVVMGPPPSAQQMTTFEFHRRWGDGQGQPTVIFNGVGPTDVQSGGWYLWLGSEATTGTALIQNGIIEVFYKDA